MIFLFGTRTVHLTSVQNERAVCENCKTQGSIIMSIYRKHFHMFWVPLFALGKSGVTECQHCKNVLNPKEMPEGLRKEFDQVKKEAKGPLWQYTGLLLVVAFYAFIVILSILN